jgi:hypothetical protein
MNRERLSAIMEALEKNNVTLSFLLNEGEESDLLELAARAIQDSSAELPAPGPAAFEAERVGPGGSQKSEQSAPSAPTSKETLLETICKLDLASLRCALGEMTVAASGAVFGPLSRGEEGYRVADAVAEAVRAVIHKYAAIQSPATTTTTQTVLSAGEAFDKWCRSHFGMGPADVRLSDKFKPFIMGDIIVAFHAGFAAKEAPAATKGDAGKAFDDWCRKYYGMGPAELRFSDKHKPLIVGDIIVAFHAGRESMSRPDKQGGGDAS